MIYVTSFRRFNSLCNKNEERTRKKKHMATAFPIILSPGPLTHCHQANKSILHYVSIWYVATATIPLSTNKREENKRWKNAFIGQRMYKKQHRRWFLIILFLFSLFCLYKRMFHKTESDWTRMEYFITSEWFLFVIFHQFYRISLTFPPIKRFRASIFFPTNQWFCNGMSPFINSSIKWRSRKEEYNWT